MTTYLFDVGEKVFHTEDNEVVTIISQTTNGKVETWMEKDHEHYDSPMYEVQTEPGDTYFEFELFLQKI